MKTILIVIIGVVLFGSCKSVQETHSTRDEKTEAEKNELGQPILIKGKKRQLVLGNPRLAEKQNRKAERVSKYEFDNKE
jgi:hypothetical protein